MDQKIFWIAFNYVKGIGAVRMKALLDYFSSLEIAWNAPPEILRSTGLPHRIIENIIQQRKILDLEKIWADIQRNDITVLTWEDNEYPFLLKKIGQPPPVLYVRGSIKQEDNLAVSIVGTRTMSQYGRQVTEELATILANNGVTVISGLARGIDAMAHEASISASGRTLAVLGCGVDRIYPPEHRRLAGKIIEQGALLSDYPPGTPPESNNFPPRNRIISGLSLVTVIVEAGERSGALITATFAAEQGREVFAVPGSIYRNQSKGTNDLIQQGARPLIKFEDIFEVLHIARITDNSFVPEPYLTDDIETSFLQILRTESKHVDEIGEITGLPIEKVTSTLAIMELKGYIRHIGAMNYVAINRIKN